MAELDPLTHRRITFTVNGVQHVEVVDTRTHLADFLRGTLGLTGTHVGCEHGVCGACTVLVDGQSMRSCLMLAAQADGHALSTIEGLCDEHGALGVIQQAFHDRHALQCGFCTAGILMSVVELLESEPDPCAQTVKDVLSGHLCRCTGYQNIVAAVLQAAAALRARKEDGRSR
jgi:carbon-monoxide dehydrogenase small subunit